MCGQQQGGGQRIQVPRQQAEGDQQPTTVDTPGDLAWVIATHAPAFRGNRLRGAAPDHDKEAAGFAYAQQTHPDKIWRMNGHHAQNVGDRAGAPAAALNTLHTALDDIRNENAGRDGVVFYWHGTPIDFNGPQPRGSDNRPIGDLFVTVLHSLQNGQISDVDFSVLARDQSSNPWRDRAFPIGWNQRRTNRFYVKAVTSMAKLPCSRLYFYGCRLGSGFQPDGMLGLVADLDHYRDGAPQKEIWAYTDYVAVRMDGSELLVSAGHNSDVPVRGAVQRGNGYSYVVLRAMRGLLPGWQVRARMDGGTPVIDIAAPPGQSGSLSFDDDIDVGADDPNAMTVTTIRPSGGSHQ